MSAKQRKLDTSHSRQEKAIKDSLENQSERLDRTKGSQVRGRVRSDYMS